MNNKMNINFGSKIENCIPIGGDPDDPYYRYRFSLDLGYESKHGGRSIIKNIDEIGVALGRPTRLLTKYISKTLGCRGKLEKGKGLIVPGHQSSETVKGLLQGFIREFILCPSCGNPETEYSTSKKSIRLKCKACGSCIKVK